MNLLLAGCGRPEPAATASPGCVWLVEGRGDGRLYLCGTIHILRPSDYPLPSSYETAYHSSDELILELPPGASASGNLTLRMRELGTLPPETSLEQLIAAANWEKIRAWAKKRGMDPALLNRFHPWFVSLILVAAEYEALGAGAAHGVDQHFEERAKRDGKPGSGLETVEEQLRLFTQMTPEQEREALEQTLAELETVEAEYKSMISAWKKGDLNALQEMLFREAERHPDLMEIFLHARNRAWAPRLAEVLERGGRAMVLVGAGHLGGEQGLLRLLEKQGWSVRQVSPGEN